MLINNKNAVITGASSGIGYEVMIKLLQAGCKVVATSRNISKISYEHENLYKFDCDVSSAEGVDILFNYALDKLRSIDIFFANAGFAYYEFLGEPDMQHIQKIFMTNVFSAFYAAQKLKQISGSKPYNFVVNASAMGFVSLPGYSLYSSTKAAIRGFADSYRYELNKGQYFQVVYPIATVTNFFQAAGGIPMAWPRQTAEHVAKSVIKGIKKNKAHIHPSKLFRMSQVLFALCPPLVKVYNIPNLKAFKKWQEENNGKN